MILLLLFLGPFNERMKQEECFRILCELVQPLETGFIVYDCLQEKDVFVVGGVTDVSSDTEIAQPLSGSKKVSRSLKPCRMCLVPRDVSFFGVIFFFFLKIHFHSTLQIHILPFAEKKRIS